MLNSLEIKNYRNLRHLRIEKLGRVNLIVGKNNTGKSSLLEILGIYLSYNSDDFFGYINSLLANREGGEITPINPQINIDIFSNLFTDRKYDFYDRRMNISIGEIDDIEPLKIQFVRTIIYPDGTYKILENDKEGEDKPHEIEFWGKKGDFNQALIILNGNFQRRIRMEFNQMPFKYIRSSVFISDENPLLWSKIALTEKEKNVIEALNSIDKSVERLAFVNEGGSNVAKVKQKNSEKPVSLRSMGDGINRILTIILAMVNCENGYLLIDEFENGLHYSVQEKLWEIIFFLANKLNVQVFATTHSSDAIRTFEDVANSRTKYHDAQLIKLRAIDGEIEAVEMDAEDLKILVEGFVDPR